MSKHFLDDPATTLLETLIDQVSHQDAAALRTLFELTSSRLFGITLCILGRREWANDVLQDAFVTVWRSAVQYRHEASGPMAWLTVIARNRTFDYLRQLRARGADRETAWSRKLEDKPVADIEGPFETAFLKDETAFLALALNKLDGYQRRAITLSCLCQLTQAEIAEVMNAPLRSVKTWIRSGTRDLRLSLDMVCTGEAVKAKK